MSKFFIQMLLSVMVGISAVFGFNPHVNSHLHDAWQQAGISLREATDMTLKSAAEQKLKVEAGVSIQAVSKTSAAGSEKVNLTASSNWKAKNNKGKSLLDHLLPAFSLNNSASVQTQTGADVDGSGLDVNLKDKTSATLKLNLTER